VKKCKEEFLNSEISNMEVKEGKTEDLTKLEKEE